jgi:23S rRNA (cytosine1962-C5)-methyltransferase
VARALGEGEARAAQRVRAGALRAAERFNDPAALVPPGTALALDARAPRAALPAGPACDALVPAPPFPSGRCEGFAFEVSEERGGVARVRLALEAGGALERARAWLAAAGSAVLGDLAHGGILVAGGIRLAAAGDALDFPDEPAFPPGAPAPEATLRISGGTARALERGHPWVIADRETETGDRFAPGTLVVLTDRGGRAHGLARTEGARDLAAVLWSPRTRPREVASIEERVARALERRRALLGANAQTDAVRVVHGEADGLPGLAVDRLGPALRVLVLGRAALPLRERVLAALRAASLPGLAADPPVVEVLHLRERPPGELACVRLVAGAAPPAPLVVREGALRFEVELGLAEPARPRPGVGLFLDQRENRARVALRAARGGRYLNLFAHTGGFSAALLAGGADEVWSVDLSAPYLEQLGRNLARSGLAGAKHRTVRREARRFLAELEPEERFAGMVLDPPTAAASGRRFWSVRRDLEPLTAAALARLAPGGFVLVTRQDRAARGGLEALLARAAASAGVELAAVEPAPPGRDFPAVRGFPEGLPFEAVLATRA